MCCDLNVRCDYNFFLYRFRCEETTDEAEEQGDILRYSDDIVLFYLPHAQIRL